jgi:hypothetical protein
MRKQTNLYDGMIDETQCYSRGKKETKKNLGQLAIFLIYIPLYHTCIAI